MKDVFIAIKQSKYERDLERFGSDSDVKHLYEAQNNSYEKIFRSHERQQANLRALQEILPGASSGVAMDKNTLAAAPCSLVVSFGGDNFFVYVSRFVGHVPIVGLNSDPETSIGALLYYTVPRLQQELSAAREQGCHLASDLSLDIDPWTQIAGQIHYPNGRSIQTEPCFSEISIRNGFADMISRYLVRRGGEDWEEQKSSGLLLATGTGSTGWFKNCHPSFMQKKIVFPRNADYFRIVARELSNRHAREYQYKYTMVHADENLEVISEMDGEITVDAYPERCYPFPAGARAVFSLRKERLAVVRQIQAHRA